MRKYILFFALVLLFFGMLGQNVSTFLMDKLSEQSTVEMSAVVSNVGCNVTDENVYWSIGVKEPSGELLINSSVGRLLDAATMETLEAGQTITFRMDISTAQQYRETGSGYIVALKADHVIFSIEEYNEIMRQVTLPAEIVGIIFQVCLLLLLIYLARKYKIGQFFRRKKRAVIQSHGNGMVNLCHSRPYHQLQLRRSNPDQ